MRRNVAALAGLAGLATLPALGATGSSDNVSAWLRGLISGTPTPVQQVQDTGISADEPADGSASDGVNGAQAGVAGGAQLKTPALASNRPQRQSPVAAAGPQRVLPDDPNIEAEDPFATPTYRVGSWIIRPSVDAAIGRTNNMQGKAGGDPGTLWRIRPEVTLASDWSRHALEISMRGTFNGYPSQPDLNTPAYDANAKLRLDLADEMRADLALRLSSSRGAASSADNPAGTAIPSTTLTRGASLGLTRDVGLFGVTLRGDVDRATYSGGQLSDGSAIETDASRNNTRAVLALRTSYDASPAVKPFVEVQQTVRRYDSVASRGRDSTGQAILGGATLRLGALLSGELAAGWTREQLSDSSLPVLSGTTIDAALLWSPTPLARIRLTAKTTLDPTTLAGSSGSISREIGATWEQSLRRDLTATVGARAQDRAYSGLDRTERTVSGEGELAWSFDPHLQVYGRGEWLHFSSGTASEAYSSVTVMTGIRIR